METKNKKNTQENFVLAVTAKGEIKGFENVESIANATTALYKGLEEYVKNGEEKDVICFGFLWTLEERRLKQAIEDRLNTIKADEAL